MAAQASIDAVNLQLPDEAEEMGIDEDVIGAFLDSGLSQTKTILACWRAIAAKASTVTDVNESGSSRSAPVFDRAKQMIDFWQIRSDEEDKAAYTLPVREHATLHTGVRV